MRTLIENYRNLPGQHCGSTAMKNLLFYYCGLELSEEVIFGLGSGIDFMYIKIDGLDPAAMIFGRSITMETDCTEALGVDYREQPETDNRKAWLDVRQEVVEGRPVMLTGDVFFLDYRKFKVRFPAHRFVLLGFDDEKEIAYLADRVDPEPQACSYKALAMSRNPDTGITTYNLWGKFFDTKVKNTLEQAVISAIYKNALRMNGLDTSQIDLLKSVTGDNTYIVAGVSGLKVFADDLKYWHERDDAASIASYASQAIEKFGTGGANFRRLFASFLHWASEVVPNVVTSELVVLAERSAEKWTELAIILDVASQKPYQKETWDKASHTVSQIYNIESKLFEKLKKQ